MAHTDEHGNEKAPSVLALERYMKYGEEKEMPILSPDQHDYVALRASGKSPQESYRKVFLEREDGRMPEEPNVPPRAVAMLENHPDVRVWIELMRVAAMESHLVTMEEHTAQLVRIREKAIQKKQLSTALKAEEARGKIAGLYVNRHEHVHEVNTTSLLEKARQRARERNEQIEHDPPETLDGEFTVEDDLALVDGAEDLIGVHDDDEE